MTEPIYMMKSILHLIKNRRSVRRYSDKGVPGAAVRRVLEAGRWAPSGLNNQPCRFIVVKDPGIKDRMAALTESSAAVRSARVLIAVFLDKKVMYNRTKDIQAAGACMQNMLLEAHALELGACWLGEILNKKKDARGLLGAPKTYELMGVISLGWPARGRRGSSRKSLKSLVYKTICAVICVASWTGAAHAIPSFGTQMPAAGKYHAGYRANFVFNRDVEDYEEAGTYAYHYELSYGFSDWFCFDGMIGLGGVEAEYTNRDKLEYSPGFSGGYGFRAKIYDNQRHELDWVMGFQHMSTHPGKRRQVKGHKYEIIWDEWQFSTTMSKKLWRFIPYCGMKWSFIYLIDKVDGDRHRKLSEGAPVGLIVGTDFRLNDYLFLNAEGRFFDEEAVSAGLTMRY